MEVMYYKSNPSNSDYIMISANDCVRICSIDCLDQKVTKEVKDLDHAINEYEREKFLFDDISIRKDSVLGNYMIEHNDMFKEYISYSDVVGALNIAMYTDNKEMSDKILELFIERKNGARDDLVLNSSPAVIDYISSNRSYSAFLNELDGEGNAYVVYDKGTLFMQQFSVKSDDSQRRYVKK